MTAKKEYLTAKEKRIKELEKLIPQLQSGKKSFAEIYEEMKLFPASYFKKYK